MGYDLHITRRELWFEEGEDISLEEFIEHVRGDSEFRHPFKNAAEAAEWHSPITGSSALLRWTEGRITAKNPQPEAIAKMVAVARALDAQVQGDEGEVYLSATEIRKDEERAPELAATHSPPPAPSPPPAFFLWPLWKKLLVAFLAGCALLALKLLISK